MAGKRSRDKGKRGERELVKWLQERDIDAKRRGMTQGDGDGDADVVGVPGFHIEVKRTERFYLYEAIEQAEDDKQVHEIPVVFHRRNKKDWVVILHADDFIDIIRGEKP